MPQVDQWLDSGWDPALVEGHYVNYFPSIA